MNLNPEQLQTLANLLGEPSIRWSREPGVIFRNERDEELDYMVSQEIMWVKETAEAWGPTVTYGVTEEFKKFLAKTLLFGKS